MNDFDDHIRKRKYPWIGRKWKRAVSSYVNHFLIFSIMMDWLYVDAELNILQ
jgi:hypothetical protein